MLGVERESEEERRMDGRRGGGGRERETTQTLSPKKILELLAMASINLSSRNSGVSFNLLASASLIVLNMYY